MKAKVKICGLTNTADMEWVCRCKADYAGMLVEIPQSSRSNTIQNAILLSEKCTIPFVAVTMDLPEDRLLRIASELNPHVLQLHGNEPFNVAEALKSQTDCTVWKVIHLPAKEANLPFDIKPIMQQMQDYQRAGVDAFLIDSMITVKGETHLGGTGKTSDWDTVAKIRQRSPLPVILAGGINPQNVSQAIRTVKPFAVDVSSGVELIKAKKDPDKVLELITHVRQMDFETGSVV